jgi:hydrogenase maturation protease
MKRTRIIGCGACDRGDDEAGLLAAEALRRVVPPPVEVMQNTAGGARLLDGNRDVDRLVLIDAALATPRFPAGTWRRIAYPAEGRLLADAPAPGTHALSLADALRLAETLGQLPAQVVLFLLAGDRFEAGTRLSETLAEPLARLVEQIHRETTE